MKLKQFMTAPGGRAVAAAHQLFALTLSLWTWVVGAVLALIQLLLTLFAS